jgi:O-antigen ligase
MASRKSTNRKKPITFWVLCAFLILAFLTGGSSRPEVQSLAILRPLAVLVCFYAAWHLSTADLREHKFLIGFAIACFALAGIHLIPLPPEIWHALPNREIIIQIDKEMGFGPVWRPLSLEPVATWNALYSLFVPLAVLLLGLTLKRDSLYQLLPVVIGLGLITGLVGLIQAASGSDNAVNLYQISNQGSAVGLFGNRNHQAVFLATMFPLLAIYACAGIKSADQARIKLWIALAVGFVLIPLLMATGSRAGILTGLIGLLSAPFLYRTPQILVSAKRKTQKRRYYYIIGAFAAVGVGLLSILFSRAEAFDRLFANDFAEDLRTQIFASTSNIAWSYLPFGSGMGSFVSAFKMGETTATLSPQYINRAHNDYLELYLTGGLPALLLLFVAISAVSVTAWRLWLRHKDNSQAHLFARAGVMVSIIFMMASTGDYPLRMPSLMCFAVIIVLWMENAARPKIGDEHSEQHN